MQALKTEKSGSGLRFKVRGSLQYTKKKDQDQEPSLKLRFHRKPPPDLAERQHRVEKRTKRKAEVKKALDPKLRLQRKSAGRLYWEGHETSRKGTDPGVGPAAKSDGSSGRGAAPQQDPKRGKLKFTPQELAAEGIDVGLGGENWRKSKVSSHGLRDKYRQEISTAISQEADASENDAVRAADRGRIIGGTGARAGSRYRKHRIDTADKRLEKRQNKHTVKEWKRQEQSRKHWERYGDERPREYRKQQTAQKHSIKRKQIRELSDKTFGKKNVDAVVKFTRALAQATAKAISWAVSFLGWPVLGFLLAFVLLLGGAGFIMMLITNTSVTMAGSYTAEDKAMEAASLLATELEAKLEQEISGLPSAWEWGHIDEFRYDTDPIGHDPFELMAWLSVTQPGFDMGLLSPVPGEIRRLHESRYDLILEQQIEVRYTTEMETDPITGEITETEVPYDYYILNVILRSQGIEQTVEDVLRATPKSELWEWYRLLMETRGSRQEFSNPFGNWDWKDNITSRYGWRIDPVNGRNLQIHRGLDIAMPEGTPIAAGLAGRVRYVGFDATYGNYIILEDEAGTQLKYAHCQTIAASQGDQVTGGETIIALVGNTGASTGSHVHIEVQRDGNYLNPIYAINFQGREIS